MPPCAFENGMGSATFTFQTAGRVTFGRGARVSAAQAVAAFGTGVCLVRGHSVVWVDALEAELSAAGCSIQSIRCRAEPDIDMLQEALAQIKAGPVDVVVAVGGGSVMDLGKALAALAPGDAPVLDHLEGVGKGLPLRAAPLPFVAIPTTAGTGSEVTKNAVIGVPGSGRKVSLRDDRMLARLAIVDPELMDDAPKDVTLASGLDALVQVIEPYLSKRSNPVTDALCREAIPKAAHALARLLEGEDAQARDDMAFASLCGGMALANAGLGAVHGLAGAIGGRSGAPHGLICGRLLGGVLQANRAALSGLNQQAARFDEVAAHLSQAFGIRTPIDAAAWADMLDSWGLARLGRWMTPDVCLSTVAQDAAVSSSMQANPCTLSEADLVRLIKAVL
ncbi:alcohol dehydrogenase, iron-containing [Roseobacter denitrificans OCh 114]|uniref:Alcohol dehydrogenase, iron-containing n=2 Tax=Roseobacter denitrificans TaxID=2434 RepID=Q165D6_ROSDO|nr:alcohol dehydrogenase, iron-containing [Roseobacter denitrificans OCh 114]